MDQLAWRVALLLAGYLSGSIPMGVVVARLTGGPDPRTVGSGRTGGNNAVRAMGPRRGITVGLLDAGKGAVPVLMARLVSAGDATVALVGVAAVLGSWRSVFLGFHGGRGVATGVGGMLVLQPLVIPLAAPISIAAIAASHHVSLGSLAGTAAGVALLGVLVAVGASPPLTMLFAVPAAGMIWLAHADNIDRLVHGRERRLSLGPPRGR